MLIIIVMVSRVKTFCHPSCRVPLHPVAGLLECPRLRKGTVIPLGPVLPRLSRDFIRRLNHHVTLAGLLVLPDDVHILGDNVLLAATEAAPWRL